MQSAEHELGRFEAVRSKIGPDELEVILHPFKIRSVAQLDNLETLQQLVAAAEEKAGQTEAI